MARELWLPPGLEGSGRRRYAAAMWFQARGEITPEILEVFRVLSPRDGDDPMAIVNPDDLPHAPVSTPQAAVAALARALTVFLGKCAGKGLPETRAALARTTRPPTVHDRTNAVVERHLGGALDALAPCEQDLAGAIGAAAAYLPWKTYSEYPAFEIGPGFPRAHAFCSLLGESDASWPARGIDIGLFLMAPGLLYRDHAHAAPELYLPLTGPHGWRFRPGAPFVFRSAFSPVWNDPDAPHATLVGDVPFLCLYAWLAHPQSIAHVIPADDWSLYEP